MKLNPAKCSFGVTSGNFLGYLVTKRGIEADPNQIKEVENLQPPRSVKEVQKLIRRGIEYIHVQIFRTLSAHISGIEEGQDLRGVKSVEIHLTM